MYKIKYYNDDHLPEVPELIQTLIYNDITDDMIVSVDYFEDNVEIIVSIHRDTKLTINIMKPNKGDPVDVEVSDFSIDIMSSECYNKLIDSMNNGELLLPKLILECNYC